MKGYILFDQLNDVVYKFFDLEFFAHARALALKLGISDEDGVSIDNDVLIQLFSPLVTSQRVMRSRMRNAFDVIRCGDDLSASFHEYYGATVMLMQRGDAEMAKHRLSRYSLWLRYFYGPALNRLRLDYRKGNDTFCHLLSKVLEKYDEFLLTDVGCLTESRQHIHPSANLLRYLEDDLESCRRETPDGDNVFWTHVHLYRASDCILDAEACSRGARQLSSSDYFFLRLLVSQREFWKNESVFVFMNSVGLKGSLIPMVVQCINFDEESDYVELLLGEAMHVSPLSAVISRSIERSQAFIDWLITNRKSSCGVALSETMDKLGDLCSRYQLSKESERLVSLILKRWICLRRDAVWSNTTISPDKIASMDIIRLEDDVSFMRDNMCALFDDSVFRSTRVYRVTHMSSLIATRISKCQSLPQRGARVQRNRDSHRRRLLAVVDRFLSLECFVYVNRASHTHLTSFGLRQRHMFQHSAFVSAWKKAEHLTVHQSMSFALWPVEIDQRRFICSYLMWFEDQNGANLAPILPITEQRLASAPPVGTWSKDFYRHVIKVCLPNQRPEDIVVSQLLCVTRDDTCWQEDDCRRLSAALWQYSHSCSSLS